MCWLIYVEVAFTTYDNVRWKKGVFFDKLAAVQLIIC